MKDYVKKDAERRQVHEFFSDYIVLQIRVMKQLSAAAPTSLKEPVYIIDTERGCFAAQFIQEKNHECDINETIIYSMEVECSKSQKQVPKKTN